MTLEPDYPIGTERLWLRPHRAEDLDDLVRFHGDPDVVRYVPWPVRDRAATEAALHIKLGQGRLREPGQWLVLAVERRDTATVIGEVLLKWASAEHRQGELGFALARAEHGRGYAAEAAREMLRLGFDELGLHRIDAVCVEQNAASARLLESLGFTRQARLVDNVWFKGRWTTQLIFALTEDEWRVGEVVRCFFGAFTSGPAADVDDRLNALRAVMRPDAVIARTAGRPVEICGVEEFLGPRRALLTDGSLTGFAERPTSGRIDTHGDIAHWFGRYEKAGQLHGEPYAGTGAKSIQLVRTETGWRVTAVAWDDD